VPIYFCCDYCTFLLCINKWAWPIRILVTTRRLRVLGANASQYGSGVNGPLIGKHESYSTMNISHFYVPLFVFRLILTECDDS
jgi:hypothetical protein